ncbi:MAG: hypothetical protein IKJ91_07050 [Clostridia bacterium]|nr:hypothetical protein [Clostridia bacterium]
MKKIRFIELVLSHLAELGATETELEKQKKYIDSYLTRLGIGEEAQELDHESPSDFAEEIFKIIKAHRMPEIEELPTLEEPDDGDDDIKVFDASESDEQDFNALGEELEVEREDYFDEEAEAEEDYATREFSINSDEVDYYASSDDPDEEEYIPVGNPVFFWIITVILSPLWIPLGIAALALCALLFVLLSVFIVAYIPLLIAIIIGGSCAILAEIIFSIVKFIGGQVHIGLFELGLAFVIGAIMVSLSVIIYRFGTKYSVKVWKKYPMGVAAIFKKIKRLIRKFKGVCSI